jgi:hypothetical protein
MTSYIKEAFQQICKEAKQAEGFYVSLMESCPFYGGPEEGGWWGHDERLISYQHFATEEQAESAKEAISKLAEDLNAEASKDFGDQCLRDMEWLDARGLDADFLPEIDGETHYYVVVSSGIPQETFGDRHYE